MSLKVIKLLLLVACISGAVAQVWAQERIQFKYEGDVQKGGQRDGENVVKLIDNVIFEHGSTLIYCDSAYIFRERQVLEAFGDVRINDREDSVTITGDKLIYSGDERVAQLRGDVVYVDDSIQLFTDFLDYDMINKSATYFNGGRIIDNVNILTSQRGVYDTQAKMMRFNGEVVLVNPDYTLEAEELIYNIVTKIARTTSYTTITTTDGRVLVAEEGSEFDTANKTSAFLLGRVETDSYTLEADELYYNQLDKYYSAEGNVYMLSKEDSVIIIGSKAQYWQERDLIKIYGNPVMKKAMTGDTLYMSADTLVSIDSEIEAEKRLLAYFNVKLFKTDMQGKCDSLAYFLADSTIFFYRDPLLWSEGSQISADSINLTIKNGTLDQMRTDVNSFIISEDSVNNFNQIKGRDMTASFKGSSIDRIDVDGNCESIYYTLDDEENQLIGMNKILASNMLIKFQDNEIDKIIPRVSPEGRFIPPHELKEDERRLAGFSWRIAEKPTLQDVLNNTPGVEEEGGDDEPVAQPTVQEPKAPAGGKNSAVEAIRDLR
jgi:lipopolysaccharide export system protein LptA